MQPSVRIHKFFSMEYPNNNQEAATSTQQTVEDWLNNEELPVTIWKNKYRQGNESFEQWLDRVSGNNPKIKKLIREQKFIFGGRILSNRGVTDRKITYSNCYCLTPPQGFFGIHL